MKTKVKQYGIFLIGLCIASFGVAFSAKAGLGTSPVASVPYSVSLLNHTLTFGGWLNVWSVLQIMIQVALLRRKCNFIEIGIQTLLAFVHGYMTDLFGILLTWIDPSSYTIRFLLMLIGCVLLAFGIWVQFKGGVAMLPGEAMNRAISIVTGFRYENIKVFFDILYIAVAAAICLIFIGRLEGVREGSIIAAVLIGNLIKLFNRMFGKKESAAMKADESNS